MTSGTCEADITTEEACAKAVAATGVSVSSSTTVKDGSLPAGCIMRPDHAEANNIKYTAVYNVAEASATTCANIGSSIHALTVLFLQC